MTAARETLTPALSHPMGEGEWIHALVANHGAIRSIVSALCSLSRRTGEGQGEGFFA